MSYNSTYERLHIDISQQINQSCLSNGKSPPVLATGLDATLFKRPTKFFEEEINTGRTAMAALADFTPRQGGVPIMIGEQVVGAIGVSDAASAQQDEELVIARANALTAPASSTRR